MSDNQFLNDAVNNSAETAADRDALAGMVAETAGGKAGDAAGPSDGSILNFALNLEYLEAEFYLRAATGEGLPSDMIGGTGVYGEVTGGRKVNFESTLVRNIAREIASDEKQHVAFLRSALGESAAARPRISLDESFTAAATAAGLIRAGEVFDAFANERNFLFAAFLFEDVGVTAFKGAAPFITNKTYLNAAAGLLATEAYHAGIVRATLFSEGLADDSVFDAISKVSAVRNAVSGSEDDDQGIGTAVEANLIPTDEFGRTFGRTPQQILNIVYLSADAGTSGGFYPDGLNGDITAGTGLA
ncbi:ferritin-like domain-containing protein [Microbacterium sp. NPDC058345]|uniref:ferritin-like domain-containing protein n=1 Tax=Microbacterium sp. NPDC058345 TaxID=3346455 RepID=UPI00366473AE